LRDDLARLFGPDRVFLDKDALHAGSWREQLQRALEQCKVVLVVIGPRWVTLADEQNRPLIQLAEDVHHQEIALALSRADVTVIPVLVDEAPLPRPEQLPPDLRKLPDQQARKIGDTQARRRADLAVLVRDIELVSGLKSRVASARQTVGWRQFDITTVGMTFGLTLTLGVYAYLANMPMDGSELLFVLVVSWGMVVALRAVWARFKRTGAEEWPQ
jgi:hypothetical protein